MKELAYKYIIAYIIYFLISSVGLRQILLLPLYIDTRTVAYIILYVPSAVIALMMFSDVKKISFTIIAILILTVFSTHAGIIAFLLYNRSVRNSKTMDFDTHSQF